MTGIKISGKQIGKICYQDKYDLKRINEILDKGVKIHMLTRLIGKKNQEIKYLKGLLNESRAHNHLLSFKEK